MAFNKVVLVGNLVADPELKKISTGNSVTTITIAVNRRFTRQGEKAETDFFDVVCWGQLAEFVCHYFTKGRPILVCGRLQSRKWVDKNGQNRVSIEVVAEEATFVGSKSDNAGNNSYQPASSQPAQEIPSYNAGSDAGFVDLSTDDELPF